MAPRRTAGRPAPRLRRGDPHPQGVRRDARRARRPPRRRRDRRRGLELHPHRGLPGAGPRTVHRGLHRRQNMIGMAVGMQVLGKVAFAATFAAFFTRAYDFVRMAAISRANLRLSGSHAGVSIGEDGPSQMGLEDLAMMWAVHGSTVLYPCDGNATARLTAAMADLPGISYIRTTREKTPIVYGPDEDFPIGGSKVLRASPNDRVTLVGAGMTLDQSLEGRRHARRGRPRGSRHRLLLGPADRSSSRRTSQATTRRIAGCVDAIGHAAVEQQQPCLGCDQLVAIWPAAVCIRTPAHPSRVRWHGRWRARPSPLDRVTERAAPEPRRDDPASRVLRRAVESVGCACIERGSGQPFADRWLVLSERGSSGGEKAHRRLAAGVPASRVHTATLRRSSAPRSPCRRSRSASNEK